MTMQTRVFIVHMLPSLGSRVFTKAKEVGMITTTSVTDLLSSVNASVMESMQGLLGVQPYVPRSTELEEFQVRWKRKFQQENPTVFNAELNIFGLRAYDATMELAVAVEIAVNSATLLIFRNPNVSANSSSSDLEMIIISQNGLVLLQAVLSTRFKGISGEFQLVNGELHSSAFEIVNINGNGTRGVGFWTLERGLLRNLNSSISTTNSAPNSSILAPIIWSGGSTSIPQLPTNEKKLQIAVPKKSGFTEFAQVTTDPNTNSIKVTGYSIAVFDALVEALPYAVNYEYIP